jgi:hypothetical protein
MEHGHPWQYPDGPVVRPGRIWSERKLIYRSDEETQKWAWFHLTNSYYLTVNGRPIARCPHIVHPFNYPTVLRICCEPNAVESSSRSVNISLQKPLMKFWASAKTYFCKAESLQASGDASGKAPRARPNAHDAPEC